MCCLIPISSNIPPSFNPVDGEQSYKHETANHSVIKPENFQKFKIKIFSHSLVKVRSYKNYVKFLKLDNCPRDEIAHVLIIKPNFQISCPVYLATYPVTWKLFCKTLFDQNGSMHFVKRIAEWSEASFLWTADSLELNWIFESHISP